MSRLVDQIKQAVQVFAELQTPPALIGGLALAAHNVVRATRDVDFLAESADSDSLRELLLGLGHRCLPRSEDAANYLRGDEGLDRFDQRRKDVPPPARRVLKIRQTMAVVHGFGQFAA